MEKVIDLIKKYKIQLLAILIILLLIPIVKITIDNSNKNYKVETVNKEKYFVLLNNNKTGIIDEKGEIIIQPEYYEIHIPNPSKAIFVCYYDYNQETGKCRTKVINEKGTELFTKYNNIDTIELNGIETTMPYEKNLLKYEDKKKYGLIDLEGKKITEAIYDEINGLSCKEGELLVKKDGKYGVISNKGIELIKNKYDYISGDEYYTQDQGYKLSGYIIGEKTNNGYRYGYMNNNQKILLNTDYNEIIRIGNIQNQDTDKNIFIIATKNGQCGLIRNKKVIIDFKYQDIDYSGVEDLFILTRGKNLGVANSKGKVILDTRYEEILVNDDYIYTNNNGHEVYYNLKGEEISESSIKIENKVVDEEENITANLVNPTLIPKEKNGKWGFVDKNSVVKVDYIYDEVTEVNKYGYAGVKKDGKWGSIDEKGKMIQEPIYKLDNLEEINFIGKYYKITYDYRNIFYTDNLNAENVNEEE